MSDLSAFMTAFELLNDNHLQHTGWLTAWFVKLSRLISDRACT